jgi:hypothetical protein
LVILFENTSVRVRALQFYKYYKLLVMTFLQQKH